MSKHTPEPWRITKDEFAIVIQDSTDNTIAEFTVDNQGDAEFYRSVNAEVHPILPDEALANATLFLAAPKLLAMLEEIVDGGYLDRRPEEKRRIIEFLEDNGLRIKATGGAK